jgi:hypothetical protein
VAAISSAAALAVKLASIAPVMAVAAADNPIEPSTVDALVSINDMCFVVFGFLAGVAFAATGVGMLRTDAPRWLAWWASVAGGLALVAGGVGVIRPDSYLPIPFLTLLLWLVVLGVVAALGRASATDDTPEPVWRPMMDA